MATLTLVLRIPKGSALTHAEMDANLTDLGQYSTDLDAELRVQLAGTGSGDGASLIGIEDPSGRFSGFNVESAIDEIPTSIELASDATGEGASLIGVEDVRTKFSGTDVESVLEEIDDDVRRRLPIEGLTNPFVVSGMTVTDPSAADLAIDISPGKFASAEKIWDYPGVSDLTFPSNRFSYVFLTPGNPDLADEGSQAVQTMPAGDPGSVANMAQATTVPPYMPRGRYRYLIAPLAPRLGAAPDSIPGETPPITEVALDVNQTITSGVQVDWSLYNDVYCGGYRIYRKFDDIYGLHSEHQTDEFRLISEISDPGTQNITDRDPEMDNFILDDDGNYQTPPTDHKHPVAIGNGWPILLKIETDGSDIVVDGVTDIRDENEPRFDKVVDIVSDQKIDGLKEFSEIPKISQNLPTNKEHAISLGSLNNELTDLIVPGHGILASSQVSDDDVSINIQTDLRHGGHVSGHGGIHLNTSGIEGWFNLNGYLHTVPAEVTPHFLHIVLYHTQGTSTLECQWENDAGAILRPYTRITHGYEDKGYMVAIPFFYGATRLRFRTGPASAQHTVGLIIGLSFTSLPSYETPAPGSAYYTGWHVPNSQFGSAWDSGNWSHLTSLDYNTSYINENDYTNNDDRIYCGFDRTALYNQLVAADPVGIEAVELAAVCTAGVNVGGYPMSTPSTVRFIIDNYGDSVGATLGPEQPLSLYNSWGWEYDEFLMNPWAGREWRLDDFVTEGPGRFNCFGISSYYHGFNDSGSSASGWISCTYLRMRVRYRK